MTGSLADRFAGIRERIPKGVTLVAVSKNQPADQVESLYRLGHRDFGENYAQELAGKAAELERRGCAGIRWHFVGHLQTNKVKLVVPWATAMHSIDSIRLAETLSGRLPTGRSLESFLEVNVSRSPTKGGFAPGETAEAASRVAALPGIELLGLMAIPEPGDSGAFVRLRELELECRPHSRGGLSMGMSEDFEEAIRQGATHVRIGTAIFGPRLPN